jgi:O-antigen ligase
VMQVTLSRRFRTIQVYPKDMGGHLLQIAGAVTGRALLARRALRREWIMTLQEQIEVAVVLFAAILCLTGSFWKAILVGVFVLVACLLGFGRRWLLGGSFAIAIVAIAVVLGAPSRDQWLEWWQDARRAFSVWLPRY